MHMAGRKMVGGGGGRGRGGDRNPDRSPRNPPINSRHPRVGCWDMEGGMKEVAMTVNQRHGRRDSPYLQLHPRARCTHT